MYQPLHDYYASLPHGQRGKMAKSLGIARAYLYGIVTGRKPVPAKLYHAIEHETRGAVTVRGLARHAAEHAGQRKSA